MNIKLLLNKLKDKLPASNIVSRQTLLIIIAAIIVGAGAYYALSIFMTDESAIDSSKNKSTRTTVKNGVLVAAVDRPVQNVRDLFHYANQAYGSSASSSGVAAADPTNAAIATVAVAAAPPEIPALKGIAKSGITRYALLAYAGKTRLYRSGDSIGDYRVITINNSSVLLSTPDGPQVINQQRQASTAKQLANLAGGGINADAH